MLVLATVEAGAAEIRIARGKRQHVCRGPQLALCQHSLQKDGSEDEQEVSGFADAFSSLHDLIQHGLDRTNMWGTGTNARCVMHECQHYLKTIKQNYIIYRCIGCIEPTWLWYSPPSSTGGSLQVTQGSSCYMPGAKDYFNPDRSISSMSLGI